MQLAPFYVRRRGPALRTAGPAPAVSTRRARSARNARPRSSPCHGNVVGPVRLRRERLRDVYGLRDVEVGEKVRVEGALQDQVVDQVEWQPSSRNAASKSSASLNTDVTLPGIFSPPVWPAAGLAELQGPASKSGLQGSRVPAIQIRQNRGLSNSEVSEPFRPGLGRQNRKVPAKIGPLIWASKPKLLSLAE